MKKVLIKSLIVTLVGNLLGFLINLISFYTKKTLPLSIPLSGGEWTGQRGFGLLLNHTYPMTNDPNVTGSIWITFDPSSFIPTLLLFFGIAFVVFLIIWLVGRKKSKENQSGT